MTNWITTTPENAIGISQTIVSLPNGSDTLAVCYMMDSDSDQEVANDMELNHAVERGHITVAASGEDRAISSAWDLINYGNDRCGLQLWGTELERHEQILCFELVEDYLITLDVLERSANPRLQCSDIEPMPRKSLH
jgi:hypothetical protein